MRRFGIHLFAFVVGFCILLNADRANAAAIHVTTTNDELNTDGDCSLREAVQAANSNAAVDGCEAGTVASVGGELDVIMLPAGTYHLTRTGASEDNNATGDLDVYEEVSLYGDEAGGTFIDASTLGDRVVDVWDAPLYTGYLTISGGHAPDASTGQNGGAVRVANGSVSFVNCWLYDNHAGGSLTSGRAGGHGGAVALTGSTSQFSSIDSIFEDNHAGTGGPDDGDSAGSGGNGGALYAASIAGVYIQDTTFEDNHSGTGGDESTFGGAGGAVYAISIAQLWVTSSEFVDNIAGLNSTAYYVGHGGAIYGYGADTQITSSTFDSNHGQIGGGVYSRGGLITNCTFYANTATLRGGGVGVSSSGTLKLSHSTLYFNAGGGVSAQSSGVTAKVHNSIVADNVTTDLSGYQDCVPVLSGTVESVGYNIFGTSTGCTAESTDQTITNGTADDDLFATPAFGDHEGFADTLAILDTSIAYDTGVCTNIDGASVTTDARNKGRPMGATCDIGAFEVFACDSTCTTCDAAGSDHCTSCPANNYLFFGNCVPCRTECDDGEFMETACTATADAVCTACTTTCGAGTFQDTACTATADTSCTTCSTCGANEYTNSACTSTTDTMCDTCSTCGVNEYTMNLCTSGTAASLGSDTTCGTCSTCNDGEYTSTTCNHGSVSSLGNDTLCDPCTVCGPDQYQVSACVRGTASVAGSDTVCAPLQDGGVSQDADIIEADGSVEEDAAIDGTVADANVPDMHVVVTPDASEPDMNVVVTMDADVPDMHVVVTPDASAPDMFVVVTPDASTPDMAIVVTPDASTPDMAVVAMDAGASDADVVTEDAAVDMNTVATDAAAGDAFVARDASIPWDGSLPFDGAIPLDAHLDFDGGDSFGGSSGCNCAVGEASPQSNVFSSLAALAIACALYRRRRA